MNVFRLVDGGKVDKIIAFDELPKRLLFGIKTKPFDGFPSFWKRWAAENRSVRAVSSTNHLTGIKQDREEPCTFILDYKTVNDDRERWQEISNYVRKAVDLSVRLLDKLEDMAVPLAKDSHSELSIEPEQVPVIPVPSEAQDEPEPTVRREIEAVAENPPEPVKRKAGRPRKVAVGV